MRISFDRRWLIALAMALLAVGCAGEEPAVGMIRQALAREFNANERPLKMDLGCKIYLQVQYRKNFERIWWGNQIRLGLPIWFTLIDFKDCHAKNVRIYQLKKGVHRVDGEEQHQEDNVRLQPDAYTLDSVRPDRQLGPKGAQGGMVAGGTHQRGTWAQKDAPGYVGVTPTTRIQIDLHFQTWIVYEDCCDVTHSVLISWGGVYDNTGDELVNRVRKPAVLYLSPNPGKCSCRKPAGMFDGKRYDLGKLNPDNEQPAAEWGQVQLPRQPPFGGANGQDGGVATNDGGEVTGGISGTR